MFEQVVPLLASTIHADLGGPQATPSALLSSVTSFTSASAGVPAVPFSATAANASERADQAPAFGVALASLPLSMGAGDTESARSSSSTPVGALPKPGEAAHVAMLHGPAGGANAALFDVFNRQLAPANLPGFVSSGLATVDSSAPARISLDAVAADDAADSRAAAAATQPQQRLVADYLARRYRVAQRPMGNLVRAAFETGHSVGIDPLLLLSVMAIESGFNPYAESGVGAQGLMQVMATVHRDKFEDFGGPQAALQPLANLKVGALVLTEYIRRSGSIAGGLRMYVGSTVPGDGGYGVKVLAERDRLRDVARGRRVPVFGPAQPVVASVKPARVSLTLSSVSHKTPGPSQTAAQSDPSSAEVASNAEPADASVAPATPADADAAPADGAPRQHRAAASAAGRASAVQAGDTPPATGALPSMGNA
ncbi:MAG: transglycosylase SLT domain-containing protein [Janthinobacterium lividum]